MVFQLMTSKNLFTVGEGIIGPADNKSGCSVERNLSENFFYCNMPESVTLDGLADIISGRGGAWLAREYVTGSGQIYTWHKNVSGRTINSVLLLYNSNSTPVTVTFSNIGLTNGAGYNDRAAWEDYYNGRNAPVTMTLQANDFKSVMLQSGIQNGNNFGKVARFKMNGTGLYFYDLAYASNSGTATDYAPHDESTSRPRGLGQGFYENMTVRLTLTDTAATQAFSLGGIYAAEQDNRDSFMGKELIHITDSATGSSNASYDLYGCYGVQMRINLTINNQCSSTKKVRIFMGSYDDDTGGYAFCRFNKQFYKAYTPLIIGPYEYVDVLYDDALPRGESTVTFDYVVPATASAPSIIGARWVY